MGVEYARLGAVQDGFHSGRVGQAEDTPAGLYFVSRHTRRGHIASEKRKQY